MNQKIKQLRDQARDFYLQNEDLDLSSHELHRAIEAKFAELIIRECIDSIDYHMSSYCISDSIYEEGIYEGMAHSIRLIENKFGVEE